MFKEFLERWDKKFKAAIVIGGSVEGELVPIKEVNDPTFSEEILGKGVAIKPFRGRVVAPADAVIDVIFDTNHAVSLVTDKGVELLIHVGIDTVELKGQYFKGFVKAGEKVKAGQVLIEFDVDSIKAAGYDTICPIVICNSGDYERIEVAASGRIKELDEVITIKN
ncbi:MAG: PTS glucose transporter subunit IIA [Clostridium sp.]